MGSWVKCYLYLSSFVTIYAKKNNFMFIEKRRTQMYPAFTRFLTFYLMQATRLLQFLDQQ